MNKTVLLTREEVVANLTPVALTEWMKKAFAELSDGSLKILPRNAIFHESGNILAQMPASVPSLGVSGTKIAMFPGPGKAATAQSAVLLFDSDSGAMKAIVAAEPITMLRTAAVSAAATDVLAVPEAEVLCLLGAGVQAVGHAQAISAIRPIRQIRVWSIDEESVNLGVANIRAVCPDAEVIPFLDAEAAVTGADIVCTVSKAREPILFGQWLKPGAHVNAVGAVAPFARELDESVLNGGKVYVDHKDTSLGTAGDLLIPIKAGTFSADQIVGEIGQVINGTVPGREAGDNKTITVFESVGLGAQDVVAAYAALQSAQPVHEIVF